jgi:dihydrofolate synthase/folylpolyglutamate synthase
VNAIDYLMGLENRGVKFGLNNIRYLLAAAGDPQKRYPSVHVAGTNGKGSVVAYVASALKASGSKVGTYTSPHLLRFNERISVDGKDIPDDALARLIEKFRPVADSMEHAYQVDLPTFFELSTAIAFDYFAEQAVDYATVETGLGGRLDSTNVLAPEVAVITNISIDHTDYLGSTIQSIAYEKAGIINGSGPVVTAVKQPEAVNAVKSACERHNVEMYTCGEEFTYTRRPLEFPEQIVTVTTPTTELELKVSLAGAHQAENVAVAAMVCSLLQQDRVPALTDETIRTGFEAARWSCRLEVVRRDPLTIVDAAHNPAGAAALRQTIDEHLADRSVVLVLALSNDKDVDEITKLLCPTARHVIATQYGMRRTMPADRLLEIVRRHTPTAVSAPTVAEAITIADRTAGPNDVIIIAGSVFTAGDALAHCSPHRNEVIST